MKKNNPVKDKSFDFAVSIIRFEQYLRTQKHEYIISKQLLRSGTSIGANIEEGLGSQSGKDFYHKLNIAYKEARESLFWLRLLDAAGTSGAGNTGNLISDCEELLKLLGSILKTLRSKDNNKN